MTQIFHLRNKYTLIYLMLINLDLWFRLEGWDFGSWSLGFKKYT